MEEEVYLRNDAQLASMTTLLLSLRKSAEGFGRSLTDALAKGVVEGRRFEDVLKSIGKSLVTSSLKAALKPVELGIASLFQQGFEGLFKAAPPFASGGVFGEGRVRPFAEGGVIASPTYFPMAGGLGLMGERGAEAIMPLSRGPDGKLGVRGGQGASPVSVTVNISTPDVEGFRRSEAQVSASLARAVSRGRRAL
jgi:phage-related minor tail protein